MRKKIIIIFMFLPYCSFIFYNNYIFSERIDILKIRANNIKKELNLNDEQTEKIYNILQEEKKINKSRVYNYIEQALEEIIEKEKNNYDYIQKMIIKTLSDSQYQKYLSIKSRSINNELTLYLIKELNLNHRQAVELNVITPLICAKLKYVIPEKKINEIPNSNEIQKNMKIITDTLSVLEKEINSKLNIGQLQNFKQKKNSINRYIQKNIFGFENLENNENPDNKNNEMNKNKDMKKF